MNLLKTWKTVLRETMRNNAEFDENIQQLVIRHLPELGKLERPIKVYWPNNGLINLDDIKDFEALLREEVLEFTAWTNDYIYIGQWDNYYIEDNIGDLDASVVSVPIRPAGEILHIKGQLERIKP